MNIIAAVALIGRFVAGRAGSFLPAPERGLAVTASGLHLRWARRAGPNLSVPN
jgi:hypothetical protein